MAGPHDYIANAVDLQHGTTTYADNNRGASKEAGEGGGANSTVWFRWKPKKEYHGQQLLFELRANYDCYLGIWTGPEKDITVGKLAFVTQNDDYTSTAHSYCPVTIDSEKIYYIQCGGYSSSQGEFTAYFPEPKKNIAYTGDRSTANAYGSRSYGGGGLITAPRGAVGMGMVANAGSTVRATIDSRTKQGDIVAIAAPVSGPSDIGLYPAEGPNTLASGPHGVATMSAYTSQSHSVSSQSVGKAAVSINLGETYAIFSTSAGRGGARDQFGTAGFWYLGSPFHVDGFSTGIATASGEMTIFSDAATTFGTRVFLYDSRPNPQDVNLAPEGGPGETHSFLTTAVGSASVSITMINARPVVITAAGRAGAVDQLGNVGSWYLGSPFHVDSISAGVAGARDQRGIVGGWYLGSPFHIDGTSNGRGQISYNYLGSPFRVESTSAGRAGFALNKLSGAVYFAASVSNGVGGARDQLHNVGSWYLGSPFRVAMTSAGVAAFANNYLAGPLAMPSVTSNGVAGGTWYLAGPVEFAMTSAGRAVTTMYLASKVYHEATFAGRAAFPSNSMGGRVDLPSWTSHGRAGGTIYTSTPIRMTATSTGRAVATFYLAGRTDLHMKTDWFSGGGGQWYLAGRVTLDTTSRGRATFEFKSDNFGVTISRGVASVSTTINVELGQESRNRFAMTINAGCRAYDGYRSDTNPQFFSDWGGPGSSKTGYTGPQGVFFYQTGVTYLPVVSRGVSTMRENEEFIPWNFRTTVNARSSVSIYLASTTQLRNNDPYNDWHWWVDGKSTMGGEGAFAIAPDFEFVSRGVATVRMQQIGATYLHSTTDSYIWYRQTVHITLSAPQRLYWNAHGIGLMRFTREGVWISDGVASYYQNYINNESYNFQTWHTYNHGSGRNTLYPDDQYGNPDPRVQEPAAGARAFASMYGAGRTEQAAISNGKGGGWNYLHGPVYLETTFNGVSGPNWLDIFGFEQAARVKAGCYPYDVVSQPTDTDPGGKITTYPALIFEQDKLRVSLAMGIIGISTVRIEIEGVPIIRWKADAKAVVRFNLDALRDYKGFVAYAGSYGYVSHRERYGYTYLDTERFPHPYGVAIEQFQRRDWEANGVGKFLPLLGLAYFLVWHKWDDGGQLWPEGNIESGLGRRAGGRAQMFLQDNRRFMEFRTETNNLYYDSEPPVIGYRTRTVPLYTPDHWNMVMLRLALEMRSRGRARFRDPMKGNLLARHYSAPQPGTPTIDGHDRPAHGQYWPRKIVLPWHKVPVTHPQWYEYEYYRR